MKNFLSLISAGIIGGLIVFFLIPRIDVDGEETKMETLDKQTSLVSESKMDLMPFSFAEAAALATPVVVHIRATESKEAARQRIQNRRYSDPFSWFFGSDDFYQRGGSGSGVIISEDGYIVTNNHVIDYADIIEVTLNDKRVYQAVLVGKDKGTDLAVIKIESSNLPTIEYADSDEAKVGDWVLAVGNPFDYLTSTVTSGIISAKSRDIDVIRGAEAIESFIQTDAAVNPGNSGGALVDVEGRLLGINTAIATPTGSYAGYSFAIPVNLMKKIVDDLITYGEHKRTYVGVEVIEIDEEVAEDFDLNVNTGVLIQNVIEGSSADYAGLKSEDIIKSVNGRKINTANELSEVISRSKVGDELSMTLIRDRKEKKVTVKLIDS